MKKNLIYIILILSCLAGAGFVVAKYKDKQSAKKKMVYPFLKRHQENNFAEWQLASKNADQLLLNLKNKPDDTKSALALSNAYITEARVSGNYAYYDKAAYKIVVEVLERDPANYEALLLKSLLQLSQHHFAEGLVTAHQAVRINPNNAFVYGLLVDANVEMGDYKAALDAADKMVTIRPDIRSYARIAYLRELHGDYTGAIKAMSLAVSAGAPADESTEWCRVQLGRLYEHIGEVDKAQYQYQLSLAARPGYANALHGLARIASHNNKKDSAIYFLVHASTLVDDLEIKSSLADAYSVAGQKEKAESIYREILEQNEKNMTSGVDDPETGHYSDKEIAYVYLKQNKFDKALAHGLAEYNRRPENIDVNQLMALIYYKRKEVDRAVNFISKALLTGSKNPELLSLSGLIYYKSGDKKKGEGFLREALRNKPVMQTSLLTESKALLENTSS